MYICRGGPAPAARATPPPAAPAAPAAPPTPAAAAARLLTPESIPDFIRHKPLSPTLVERIYFDKQHPLALKKIFFPQEINSCEENETGDDPPNRGKLAPHPLPLPRLPIRLDTPPREAEEPEESKEEEEEEEEEEEDPQQSNQQEKENQQKKQNPPEEEEEEEEEEGEEKEEEKEEENKEDNKEKYKKGEGEAEEEEEEAEEVERRRKEAPRGFQKPAAQGWRKEDTGDPNEKVFVLNQEYSYQNGPHKVKIDLPDYSDADNEQKRRHIQPKPTKPRKFKKFQSFGTATPTPLAILKIRSILEDGPKDLRPFGTKTSSSVRLHRRSVRSVDTNSPTTTPPQDIIPSPTQKRVVRDSDTAENIEVASLTNKRLLDYFAKKFLNDAIVARQAIQNPHLIHEPYYQTRDHEKILEPFSISFKEEIGQRPKEATIISPIETIKKIRTKTNQRVAEQHQNILREIANNFEDRQQYLSNQKSSPKKPASSEDIKLYYAKALDGIVKNFEDTANHERTRQEALNTQHEEIIDTLRKIAKEKEQRRLAAENEEEADHEEDEPAPEKVKTEFLKVVVGKPEEKLTGDKAEEIIEKLLESEPHQKEKSSDTARDYESTKNIPEEKPHFRADVENHHYDTDKPSDNGNSYHESDKNIDRGAHDYGNDKSIERGHSDYDHHDAHSGGVEPHFDHHLEELGDDRVKVGNEDIVGPHDEHLEDDDLEDISEIDESAIKQSGTKESEIKTEKEEEHDDHEDKEEVKEDKEEKVEQKEESHPEAEKEASHKESSDFTFFQPLDFIKDLEKVIYPEVHSKEVHFPDISDKVPHFEHSDVEKINFAEKDKPFAEDDDKDIQLHESIHDEPELNADDEDQESEAEAKESDEQESKKKEHKEDKLEVEKEQPEENLETKHKDFNPFKYSDSDKTPKKEKNGPQADEDKESVEQETNKKENQEEEETIEKVTPKKEPVVEEYFDPFKYTDFKNTNSHSEDEESDEEESDKEETKNKERKEEELEEAKSKNKPETTEEYFDPFKYSDFKKTSAHSEDEESDEEETKNNEHKEAELEEAKSKKKPETTKYFGPFKYSDFKKPEAEQEDEESDEQETEKDEDKEDEEELETAKPANKPEIVEEYFDPFKYSDFKKSEPRQEDEEDEQETKKKEFEKAQPQEHETNQESSNPFKYSDYKQSTDKKQDDEESEEQETKKEEHEEDQKEPEKAQEAANPFKYSDVKKSESSDKESSQPTQDENTSKKDDIDERAVEPQLQGSAENADEESDDAEEEENEEEDTENEQTEDAEKQREEEEKLKKQAENEKALREYINEHFEVDIINGQPVPKAVKDTERYKQIVENVRTPTESFDVFAPNDFNYKNIHGFANKKFNENLKKLEKANNQVDETVIPKQLEDDDEESDDEPESEDDEEFDEEADEEDEDEKAENTADVPCRDPEFDRIEKSIKQDLKRIPSSETVGSERREEKEQPKEEQSKQAPETLKYPHEQKFADIYSDFHKKLINPEPQDSNTHQVVHPNLHTGGFKHGGVEVLENAEKVVTVPYDYDYSSSDKKLVVATTPATGSNVDRVKRNADWSYEPHSYQPGSYSPESYDPNPSFNYQTSEPQIEAIPLIKKRDEPLGPKAVVFENESGRKKTYIRVKQKQQEMYG
ncbi:hypothetical protein D910_01909 [Dendroctonus ponderosae]|uniref:Uncharacterized protein n=1 Tax=Dendroctonus ponderosae TaxID=77166 RepID=U4TWW4_DENPD|nr:hypothetical protein D910_01909 [Dendroctonus ponderosae]